MAEKTVQDVLDTMNDEQRELLESLVEMALEGNIETEDEDVEDEDVEDEGEEEMKHNAFESNAGGETLAHADMGAILADAKRYGSLKAAVEAGLEDGTLQHSMNVPSNVPGVTYAQGNWRGEGVAPYGINDPDMLFPDYRELNTPPEWLKRDTTWVGQVMGAVHHTPFSRIKSTFANITEDEARAKGYIKGHLKKDEVFSLLRRTTDPQTIYKRQKMDRDDIIDITSFDVVAWIKAEMRVMLDEELARAILIGDGRLASDEDKIQETHIRPVVSDNDLFTIKKTVTVGANDSETAKNFIVAAIKARKDYKGTGMPVLYTTEEMLTNMLLITDLNGRDIYDSEAKLCTKLRVSKIVTVEPMEGLKINNAEVMGIIVNLADYNVGADKGGAIELFDDFDIDYNQFKYLIETRCSGALIKPFSAITLTKAAASAGSGN